LANGVIWNSLGNAGRRHSEDFSEIWFGPGDGPVRSKSHYTPVSLKTWAVIIYTLVGEVSPTGVFRVVEVPAHV
jgi:hypothetical protein